MVLGYLKVIDAFFDTIVNHKKCSNELRIALYVIEDNLKPVDPEWEEERELMRKIVNKNKEYVNKEKND
jgi:hypothetical protein